MTTGSTVLNVCDAVRLFLAPIVQKRLQGVELVVAFPPILDSTTPPKVYVEPGTQELKMAARDALEETLRIGVSLCGYVGTASAAAYRDYLVAVEEMTRALLFARFHVDGGDFRVFIATIDGAPFGETTDGGLYNGEAVACSYTFRSHIEVTLMRILKAER